MSHPSFDEPGSAANADEGSETDVESGHANEQNESASFLKAFKKDNETTSYEETEPSADNSVSSSRRAKIWALVFTLAPWALSLVLFMALVSERFEGATSCYGGVKGYYTLAEHHTEYRTELMYDGVDNRNPMSEYQGWPNDEKDKLWDYFDGEKPAFSCTPPELKGSLS